MNPRSFPQMGQSESCLLPLSSAAIISPAMTIYCPDQTGTSFLKKVVLQITALCSVN